MTSGAVPAPFRTPDATRRTPVRHHPVPMRTQLAAGLEAAIRDGHLSPGTRLPSTRDLAARLGIHRSTVAAAYARLRHRGLAEGGEGERPRATLPLAPGGPAEAARDAEAAVHEALAALCARCLADGFERAAVWRELARQVEARRPRATPLELVLFEPRPGLGLVLAAELEAGLGVPVHHRRYRHPAGSCGPVIARAELVAALAGRGRGRTAPETIPLVLAGGTRERSLARRAVPRGLVTLFSVSGCVRRYARELAARDFDREISFLALDPRRSGVGTRRAAAASRLVFYDAAVRNVLPVLEVPARPVRLLAPDRIAAIRRYLGLAPRGRGT